MPIYDRRCEKCEKDFTDCYEPISAPMRVCDCGGDAPRIISCHAVTADDIPGGILIEHGIGNPDGTAKRYYSKSDIYKAAKAKGLRCGEFLNGSPPGRTWV